MNYCEYYMTFLMCISFLYFIKGFIAFNVFFYFINCAGICGRKHKLKKHAYLVTQNPVVTHANTPFASASF